jgi:hypothetical protein
MARRLVGSTSTLLGYMPDEIDLIEVLYNGIDFWVERCSYRRSYDAQAPKGCTRRTL